MPQCICFPSSEPSPLLSCLSAGNQGQIPRLESDPDSCLPLPAVETLDCKASAPLACPAGSQVSPVETFAQDEVPFVPVALSWDAELVKRVSERLTGLGEANEPHYIFMSSADFLSFRRSLRVHPRACVHELEDHGNSTCNTSALVWLYDPSESGKLLHAVHGADAAVLCCIPVRKKWSKLTKGLVLLGQVSRNTRILQHNFSTSLPRCARPPATYGISLLKFLR